MQQEQVDSLIKGYVEQSPRNRVYEEEALREDLAGMKLYDEPIIGYSDAEDSLYTGLKDPDVIGPHFLLPGEWLPGAQTVISFFLPFTEQIRCANALEKVRPADEWLHGRIEGQVFIISLLAYLSENLTAAGYQAKAPAVDSRFFSAEAPGEDGLGYTSNWSERHVAYISGLGTFSLSRGMITLKGMAGRFGSVITDWKTQATAREYDSYDEYCTKCMACARKCPVHAISKEGKDQALCAAYINKTKEQFYPYYGCGKCQTGVPCEHGKPKGRRIDR